MRVRAASCCVVSSPLTSDRRKSELMATPEIVRDAQGTPRREEGTAEPRLGILPPLFPLPLPLLPAIASPSVQGLSTWLASPRSYGSGKVGLSARLVTEQEEGRPESDKEILY